MFSKALFKQSCKANGTMWSIITFAVCFMLACVMLISGNGDIGEVKNSIQDTIIVKEIDSQFQKRSLSYYSYASDGLQRFDVLFSENALDTVSALKWCGEMPVFSDFPDTATYALAVDAWQKAVPEPKSDAGKSYLSKIMSWISSLPVQTDFSSQEDYLSAVNLWKESTPATQENAVTVAYTFACEELQNYVDGKAIGLDSAKKDEMLGSIMYTLNPSGKFNDFYTENGEDIPETYDITQLLANITSPEFILGDDRCEYRNDRAEKCASVFLAGNITSQKSVDALTEALSSYGVTSEKYASFGYTYSSVKNMAENTVITYRGREEYELGMINIADFADESAYEEAVKAKKEELSKDISSSFLSGLPSAVSDALEEIGQADLYTLIVGSIFYKLAGLLLPIIYMIMTSNNLISGQVDSGSMAYVLSTSVKRSTVVFTQAVYLIGSLLAMFALTSVTGCICLNFVTEDVKLTVSNLLLLNLGAFLVLFALSGLCFLTSCTFDRSKRSMAIGGGLSIFALVAAMLGLFGSPVIPSVVRLDALNNFNYVTVISLFDVISVIDGTNAFIWKFLILACAGTVGYILGSLRFTKKDLPL